MYVFIYASNPTIDSSNRSKLTDTRCRIVSPPLDCPIFPLSPSFSLSLSPLHSRIQYSTSETEPSSASIENVVAERCVPSQEDRERKARRFHVDALPREEEEQFHVDDGGG